LLSLAAVITLASNGFFQESNAIAVVLRFASGQQIFLLFFQFLGQYKLLSFTRDYAYRNIERAPLRRRRSMKNKYIDKRKAGSETVSDTQSQTQPIHEKAATESTESDYVA